MQESLEILHQLLKLEPQELTANEVAVMRALWPNLTSDELLIYGPKFRDILKLEAPTAPANPETVLGGAEAKPKRGRPAKAKVEE
jgi:hypothetical protein